jgi:hypothetical protein
MLGPWLPLILREVQSNRLPRGIDPFKAIPYLAPWRVEGIPEAVAEDFRLKG